MSLLHSELLVIANAYFLAGIPVACAVLAGLCSPLYRQPWTSSSAGGRGWPASSSPPRQQPHCSEATAQGVLSSTSREVPASRSEAMLAKIEFSWAASGWL